MAYRPRRPRILNELGLGQTLPGGVDQFQYLARHSGSIFLFLGLGVDPELAAHLPPEGSAVFYLEAPAFVEQMSEAWSQAIPDTWTRIETASLEFERILNLALKHGNILFFHPNARLFPGFWAPLLGRIAWQTARPTAPEAVTRSALLALQPGGLLGLELRQGLAAHGYKVRTMEATPGRNIDLPRLLAEHRPELFLSLNFHGLDPYGERFHLLRAAGSRVAVWCVDNPWHLLTGCKSNYWKEVELFVTDASFIPALQQAGAARAYHLPLGANPELFEKGPLLPAPVKGLDTSLTFVGRSSFPDKKSFFAGCTLPQEQWSRAQAMIPAGERPDFGWWNRQFGTPDLWPGKEVRQVGYCAEQSSMLLRIHALQQASGVLPIQVFGDEEWPGHLAGMESATCHPPVDYYGSLPALYAHSRYVLNVTSLLLPAGLTQRHFDVFCAGGSLLSDATPGLDIFPKDLTMPCTLDGTCSRGTLERIINGLEGAPGLRRDLVSQWQTLLRQEHSYVERTLRIIKGR